jgi:hypothetical protein
MLSLQKCALVIFCILSLGLAGCADLLNDIHGEIDDRGCPPGRTIECACATDLTGFQTCNEAGDGYDECVCDDVLDTPTDPAPVVNTPDPGPTASEPPPVPNVDAVLRDVRIRVVVVGGTILAEVSADWSATGAPDLTVDLEVMSSITYRQFTPILRNQAPVFFVDTPLPGFVQGERRFDFRIVARDGNGNAWTSNTITVQ